MDLHLTDEQAELLVAELDRIIENDRYPLSARIRALREIRAVLKPYPEHADASEAIRAAEPGPVSEAQVKSYSGPLTTLGGAATVLPRVQPIIPTSRKQPFDDRGWLFDFKYDGFRALCYLEPRRCLLVSRNGNHLARFDELGAQLAALLGLDEAILDGEVIAADATGRPRFYELLRRTRAPAYVAFDILWADAPTCEGCRSASAGSVCTALCQKDQRSFPRLCRSRAEDANSSISRGPTIWKGSSPSASPILTSRASNGSKSRIRIRRRRKAERPVQRAAKGAMKPYTGPPATLGSTAAAQARLIVWCRDCQNRVEPDPAEHGARYGAEPAVIEWVKRLKCSQCGSRSIDFVLTGAP